MSRTIEIAVLLVVSLVAALAVHAWLASRDEQQRLASTLAAQKRILDSATARETSRDATLNAALAQITKLKRDTQTPQQIVRDLPKYLPLPQPLTLFDPQVSAPTSLREMNGSEKGTGASASQGIPQAENPPVPCKGRLAGSELPSGSKTKRLDGFRIEANVKRKLGRAIRGEKSAADCGTPLTQLETDALRDQSDGAAVEAGAEHTSARESGGSSTSSADANSTRDSHPNPLLDIFRAGQQGTRTPEPVPLTPDSAPSSRPDSRFTLSTPKFRFDPNAETGGHPSVEPPATCLRPRGHPV
jgi:type II secretory pathway pseudopilin PulG